MIFWKWFLSPLILNNNLVGWNTLDWKSFFFLLALGKYCATPSGLQLLLKNQLSLMGVPLYITTLFNKWKRNIPDDLIPHQMIQG